MLTIAGHEIVGGCKHGAIENSVVGVVFGYRARMWRRIDNRRYIPQLLQYIDRGAV